MMTDPAEPFAHAPLRLFAWNLRHGGGATRTPGIVLEILEHNADVIILMEWRTRMGGQIAAVLDDHGWHWQTHSEPEDGVNGVLIASRLSMKRRETQTSLPGDTARRALARRWIEVILDDRGIALAAAHVPCDGPGRDAVLGAMVDFARRHKDAAAIILGDFNIPGREERGKRPVGIAGAGELTLGRLAALGWLDAAAASEQEPTWHGPDANTWKSSGFRIDQAWITPSLSARRASLITIHNPRLTGLSDHSAILLELTAEPPTNVHNEKPREKWPN